jgi:hypothetical protein
MIGQLAATVTDSGIALKGKFRPIRANTRLCSRTTLFT